ncbi:MAG: DNA translocase FtsK 4TM domain-containing protein, partial [Polaribacter sp.]
MTRKKQSPKTASPLEKKPPVFALLKTKQTQTILGFFLLFFTFFLCIAFVSFFFSWQEDQSTISKLTNKAVKSKNLLGKIGANLSYFFIYKGFGIASFSVAFQLFITGLYVLFQKKFSKIIISWNWNLLAMLWISITLGFLNQKYAILSGVVGFEVNRYLQTFIGKIGLVIVLIFSFIAYLVLRFKLTFYQFLEKLKQKRAERAAKIAEKEAILKTEENTEKQTETAPLSSDKQTKSEFELSVENHKPTISKHSDISLKITQEVPEKPSDLSEEKEVEIGVETVAEEEHEIENLSDKLVKDFGEFDPTLELANFKFPTFNLLKQYNETISIDPQELEANKDRIVETLKNYKIGIAEIKATVGPTITLYEIVPEAGIRISKIKNLEDDIALSLSALGIRIIAPIPGKGTIGIEVPN